MHHHHYHNHQTAAWMLVPALDLSLAGFLALPATAQEEEFSAEPVLEEVLASDHHILSTTPHQELPADYECQVQSDVESLLTDAPMPEQTLTMSDPSAPAQEEAEQSESDQESSGYHRVLLSTEEYKLPGADNKEGLPAPASEEQKPEEDEEKEIPEGCQAIISQDGESHRILCETEEYKLPEDQPASAKETPASAAGNAGLNSSVQSALPGPAPAAAGSPAEKATSPAFTQDSTPLHKPETSLEQAKSPSEGVLPESSVAAAEVAQEVEEAIAPESLYRMIIGHSSKAEPEKEGTSSAVLWISAGAVLACAGIVLAVKKDYSSHHC